jgi:two-component system chemotaxis response regulator CheY
MADTIATMQSEKVDLVLINRKLDQDYSDGTEILKKIKANPDFAAIPVMIITNYPEHQELAVAMGAEYGFGKLQYKEAATHERLSQFLNLK